jgi:hypothetical protein
MPLAIVDCGTNIRRPISRRPICRRGWTAAGSQLAALGVTPSAKRPRAAIEAAATNPSIATAIKSTATMEASASAVKTASATAMKTAASTMGTAASTTVTAASLLSECWIWQECKTDDSSKRDERSAKTECAHNLYLPWNLGALSSDEPYLKRTALYFIRFYCYARGCADAKSN